MTTTPAPSHSRVLTPPMPHLPLSSVFIWIGLFTVSWDRFAAISVGGFNVKIATAMFALGLVLTIVDWFPRHLAGTKQPVVRWAAVSVGTFTAMGLFADNILAAELQTITVLLGAIVPFAAIYLNLRVFPKLDEALTAFIRGGWFAAGFGLYQLAAFYTGLPQIVSYEAKGGGLGRISSFSYEAGYFGYFLILVLAAMFARAALRGESVSRLHLLVMVGILLLANSRATFLTLPLLLVLLFFSWPKSTARTKLLPLVIVAAFAVAFISLLLPSIFGTVIDRAASLLDPTEETSNAPRLFSYKVSLLIIGEHPISGIGAGNLIDHARQFGRQLAPDATANSVVANNAWLQALLDGGVILFAVQLVLVVVAARTLFRRSLPVSRALTAGWLAAFIVASLITSYFWDMKLWAVLALATAARSLLPETTKDPSRDPLIRVPRGVQR